MPGGEGELFALRRGLCWCDYILMVFLDHESGNRNALILRRVIIF